MLNTVTGQIGPARCKANTCPFCGVVNAFLVGGAISLAQPERMITFTQVGDDWQTVRNRMKRFKHRVVTELGRCDWAWHVEPNPKGTGHHVHAFQRGDFLSQARLSELAVREGMGRVVDIRAWKTPEGSTAGYGVKLAGISYGVKLAEAESSVRTYLAVNGGRMVHASRDFWRVEGSPVGQREAMKAWASASTETEGEWQLVRRDQLGLAGSGRPAT